MLELDAGLFSLHECENVVLCSIVYTFEDCEIGYYTTRVEVLKPVEYDVTVAGISNLEVVVSRIDSTSNEVVVFNDDLLNSNCLFFGANDVCGSRPEEMITKQHSNGAVTPSYLADNLVPCLP